MIMEPTFRDKVRIEDVILYLYLISKMPEKRLFKLQEQKLVFLIKFKAYQNNSMVFHLKFTKQKMGPVSQHIYDIRRILEAKGLIKIDNVHYVNQNAEIATITEKGESLLDEIQEFLVEEKWAVQYIDDIIKEFGKILNARMELANKYVYPIMIGNLTVEKMPVGYVIDLPIPKVGKECQMSADWIETINLFLDDNFQIQMKDLMEEAKNNKFVPYVPLE